MSELSTPIKKQIDVALKMWLLLGHTAGELSVLWQEQLKPALNPEYHTL